MKEPTLFPLPDPQESLTMSMPPEERHPRLLRPNRAQVEWRPVALDALLAEDHPARALWAYAESVDLGPLHAAVRSVEGHAGRPASDRRVLFALWLYATFDGVGSARKVARLCEEHLAYLWICGGVPVDYHLLSDFRTEHAEWLDGLLTESMATLMAEGLMTLRRVSQDGVRVRASAGASSFRRGGRLEACLQEAAEQVATLRRELESDPGATTRRQAAARERAARERAERVRRALEELPKVGAKRRAKNKPQREPRASTTDAEARVMKMPCGGFRPAYNVQFATDTASQGIVGVAVTNAGSDGGQLLPMVAQIEQRTGQTPREMLADGDFAKHEDIETLSAPPREVTVYAPVRVTKRAKLPPHEPHPGESAAVTAWRVRMGTPDAQTIYKERAATAECVNADVRNHGLYRFLVRGLAKVLAVARWHALAHNVRRILRLCPAAIGLG